ncbi:MAG: hypothetical protein H7330_16240 [Hymenobacteraceae bacterium]|nr:hypothetical protein [Hymenobacteraceae bacterium]
MKNSLLTLATALLTVGAAHAQSVADLDTKYGFRDLKFETDTSAIEGLVPSEATPLKLIASRPADAKKIGGATISRIDYGFYQGRLYEVAIVTKGVTNSHALREVLESQFGEGTLVSAAGQDRNWDGKLVRLAYREDPAFHNATVRFTHKKLNEQLQTAQKLVKKGASDL